MNFISGAANAQIEEDGMWITKEIKFSKSDEPEDPNGENMFGMFKKETHLTSHRVEQESSSSNSSSDEDDNNSIGMKPNK